jgi:hypothetical protein
MAESVLRVEPVVCECGVRARIDVKASGTEQVRPIIALNCRHPQLAICSLLTQAFPRARATRRAVR